MKGARTTMSKTVRFLSVFSVVTLALAAGVTMYLAPSDAISTPSQAASIIDRDGDASPQRFQIARAQSGDQVAGGRTRSSLPGGASSLNETYQDWLVACRAANDAKQCAMSQQQSQQNGQRVLAIELSAPSSNTVSGILVMPFGLALESGVTFRIDEQPAMQPMRFRTCVPAGCLVSVAFDAPTIIALRAGATLKIEAVADGGAPVPFSVSLQGFSTALDRVAALSR